MYISIGLILGLSYYYGDYLTTLSFLPMILHILGFHILVAEGFHLMDNINFFEKWKVEKKTKVLYYQLFIRSILNSLLMIPFYYHYYYYQINTELYSLLYTLFEITICSIVYEIVFYVGHLLLHTSLLYKYHKMHHITYGDVAISTHFMSQLDFLIEITIPYFIGPYLINCSHLAFMMWTILGVFNGLVTHSGYDIPYLVSSHFHHTHHTSYNKNIQIDYILNNIANYLF